MMRFIILNIIPLFCSSFLLAQGMVNENAAIHVQNGANLIIKHGDYHNRMDGRINNEGRIIVDGNWINDASNAVFIHNNSNGITEFTGTVTRQISGTDSTAFEELLVTCPELMLNTNSRSYSLELNGVLNLNEKRFTLSANNPSQLNYGSGAYILSESNTGNARFIITPGTQTGLYQIQFGNSLSEILPLLIQITSAGAGSSQSALSLATYPTGFDNLPYPLDVDNLNMIGSGLNGRMASADRYWIIEPLNYTSNPTSTLTFTYSDQDIINNDPDSLNVQHLQAQLWWDGGWNQPDYFGGFNISIPANNQVTKSLVNQYATFVLHDGQSFPNTPLPVQLLGFDGSCQNSEAVLKWATASEQNTSYFEVLRSVDLITFQSVGTVQAAGNSNQMIHYSYIDINPSASVAYYILKQFDLNGSSKDYGPIALNCAPVNENIFIYPNPAKDLVHIVLQGTQRDQGEILLFNSIGQIVQKTSISKNKGTNSYQLDISRLAPGNYFVHVRWQQGKMQTLKLIVF